jgi:hypothetical protein
MFKVIMLPLSALVGQAPGSSTFPICVLIARSNPTVEHELFKFKIPCAAAPSVGSLENPTDPDCVTLAAQRAPLEAWIDSAAQGNVPFVIAGDWNRRIDRFGHDDHFWRDIDDRNPPGRDLRRLPFGREAECNPSFPQPIDFLVFDDRAWQLVDEASFAEITYDPEDQDLARGTPSDHCPIAVTLELAPADGGDTDTTDLDLLYAPAEGLEGEDLRRVLHDIAKQGHSRLSYAEVACARCAAGTAWGYGWRACYPRPGRRRSDRASQPTSVFFARG